VTFDPLKQLTTGEPKLATLHKQLRNSGYSSGIGVHLPTKKEEKSEST
jgi:hypothetical protein